MKGGVSPYTAQFESTAGGRLIQELYGQCYKTLFPIFVAVGIFFAHLGFCQIPDRAIFKTRSSLDTIKVSKEWTPKTLEECFRRLDEILPDSVKQRMKSGTEKNMVGYHHGLGTRLRNSWGLWKGGALKSHFNGLGVFHPDDMSSIILKSYWRKLNDRPILLSEQSQFYKNYWKVNKGPEWFEPRQCPDTIQELGDFYLEEEAFKGVCRTVFVGYCKRKSVHLAYQWDKGWYKADSSLIGRFKNH